MHLPQPTNNYNPNTQPSSQTTTTTNNYNQYNNGHTWHLNVYFYIAIIDQYCQKLRQLHIDDIIEIVQCVIVLAIVFIDQLWLFVPKQVYVVIRRILYYMIGCDSQLISQYQYISGYNLSWHQMNSSTTFPTIYQQYPTSYSQIIYIQFYLLLAWLSTTLIFTLLYTRPYQLRSTIQTYIPQLHTWHTLLKQICQFCLIISLIILLLVNMMHYTILFSLVYASVNIENYGGQQVVVICLCVVMFMPHVVYSPFRSLFYPGSLLLSALFLINNYLVLSTLIFILSLIFLLISLHNPTTPKLQPSIYLTITWISLQKCLIFTQDTNNYTTSLTNQYLYIKIINMLCMWIFLQFIIILITKNRKILNPHPTQHTSILLRQYDKYRNTKKKDRSPETVIMLNTVYNLRNQDRKEDIEKYGSKIGSKYGSKERIGSKEEGRSQADGERDRSWDEGQDDDTVSENDKLLNQEGQRKYLKRLSDFTKQQLYAYIDQQFQAEKRAKKTLQLEFNHVKLQIEQQQPVVIFKKINKIIKKITFNKLPRTKKLEIIKNQLFFYHTFAGNKNYISKYLLFHILNQSSSQYLNIFIKILDRLHYIWSNNQSNQSKLQNQIVELINDFKEIKGVHRELSQHGQGISMELNYVHVIAKYVSPDYAREIQKYFQEGYEGYAGKGVSDKVSVLSFSVKDGRIAGISFQLQRSLGYNHHELQCENYSILIPECIADYFENIQIYKKSTNKSAKSKKQDSPVILLKNSQGFIKVFNYTINTIPKFLKGMQEFYDLQVNDNNKCNKFYVLVQVNLLQIQQYCQNFSKNIRHSYTKNTQKFLSLDDILHEINPYILISQIQKKGNIFAIINSNIIHNPQQQQNQLSQIINQQQNKLSTIVTLQKDYGTHYLICFDIVDSEYHKNNQIIKSQMSKLSLSQKTLNMIKKEQTICFIEALQQKSENNIMEMKSHAQPPGQQKREKQKKSSCSYSTIIKIALIVLFLYHISFLAIQEITQQQIYNKVQSSKQIVQGAALGYLLTQSIGLIFLKLLFLQSKQQLNSIILKHSAQTNAGRNLQLLLEEHQRRIEKQLARFQFYYIDFQFRNFLEKMWTIQFINYKIQGNVSSTNFQDIAYNVKLATIESTLEDSGLNALHFLQRNYRPLTNLFYPMSQFLKKLQDALLAQKNKIAEIQNILLYTMVPVLILIGFTILYCVYQLEYILALLYKLNKKIDKLYLKQEILELQRQCYNKSKLKWDSGIYCQINLNHIKTQKNMFSIAKTVAQNHENDSENPENYNSQEYELKIQEQIHRNRPKTIEIVGKTLWTLKFFMIWLLLMVILHTYARISEGDDEDDLIEGFVSLQTEVQDIKYQMLVKHVDLLYYFTNQQTSFTSIVNENSKRKVPTLASLQNLGFSQYVHQLQAIFEQKICDSNQVYNQSIIETLMNCSQIGNGVMNNGFLQYSIYNDLLTDNISMISNKSKLFHQKEGGKLPQIFEHLYIFEKMAGKMEQIQDLGAQEIQDFGAMQKLDIFQQFLIYFVLEILSFVMFICVDLRRILKMHQIGKMYLNLIPLNCKDDKKFMQEIKLNKINEKSKRL